MTATDPDDALLREITHALQHDGSWQYWWPEGSRPAARIAQVRSVGRRAGRELSLRVRTTRHEGNSRVGVLVATLNTDHLSAEDRARHDAQQRQALDAMMRAG